MHTAAQTNSPELNVLLIAANRQRAGLLRHSMEQRGLTCLLRRIDPGAGACAYARRLSVYRKVTPADLIIIDATDLDTACRAVLEDLALGQKRAPAPVVVLSSRSSERRLLHDGLVRDETCLFAPTELDCFLSKMHEHRRPRFLKALKVMNDLGPVLIRTPRSFSRRDMAETALIA